MATLLRASHHSWVHLPLEGGGPESVVAVRLFLLSSLLMLILPFPAPAYSEGAAPEATPAALAEAENVSVPASAGSQSLSLATVPRTTGTRFQVFRLAAPPFEHGAFGRVRRARAQPVLGIQLERASSEPVLRTTVERAPRPTQGRVEDLIDGELIDRRLTGN